ncbi:uncharacterized protein LOC122503069 [Leptopilina heterotoma]|uniref:uncharacterized protein LOC122503069 n=1 Tax=Leptopilina heterotoma TaxID=63436 RepID=UPI001CA7CBF4|nr:uncharacterized protein LOC122503069 [Leptopilina heterotoma]
MALTLEQLKIKRGSIKASVTKFETALRKINDDTDLFSLDLEGRLSRHNSLWEEFDNIQKQIEELLPGEENKQIHETEHLTFEDRFYEISGLAKKFLQRLELSTRSVQSSSRTNSVQNLESHEIPTQRRTHFPSHFQLPKIETPVFHGTFDTWLAFYDSFKSMCHDNQDIPNISKFMYLRACLRDEATEVIASLETTADNYLIAWELLKNRYDNRKFIVENHIKTLFELPALSKEFTARTLLDNLQKHLRALKALNQPVEQWDSLIVYLIKLKFNNYIRERWDEATGTTQLPTVKDLISFLEKRSVIEANHSTFKSVNSSKTNSKHSSNIRSNSKPPSTCLSTTVSGKL